MLSPAAKGVITRYAKGVLIPLLAARADYLGRLWTDNTLILCVQPAAFQALLQAGATNQAFNKVASHFALGVAHPEDVVVRVAPPGSVRIEDPGFLSAIRE